MRVALVLAVVLFAGCASEKLQLAPPAGVDFSGRWKLNEADSDNPQRLIQAQIDGPAAGRSTSGGTGGAGGRRGRGSGRDGMAGGMGGGFSGPVMPSVGSLGDGLRWPGKDLEVKQVAGVVAFTSDGINRVCQPTDAEKKPRHRGSLTGRDGRSPGRDAPPMGRDGTPPHCGWEEKTLIVQGGDPDDDHPPFEERYSVSEDGQRLVEVVGFKGGRSNGFMMSRVWDRTLK
jgi:hypothetical protein